MLRKTIPSGDSGPKFGKSCSWGKSTFSVCTDIQVCSPGRWHAALVIKMALVHLILKYDFRLENENESHKWFWETFQMPYESSKVLFRKRR